MNVHEANQNLLLLCRDCRDTSKAERDAARLALEEAIEKEQRVSELKLPRGYTIDRSGSGANLVLRYHGERVDWWPATCGAKEHLTLRAIMLEERRRDVQDVLREVPS